jgi:hypothetical protein
MTSWPCSPDHLRSMYAGGRGNAAARRFSRLWAAVFGWGLMPRRWVTLEVPGRRSGRLTRFPLGMARYQDGWYLVPMLGQRSNWVQNARAAHGQVIVRHRRAQPCQLVELPAAQRAPVIKCYLQQVPGARPHIPVDRAAPVADFEAIAPRYPVFRVVRRDPPRKRHWGRWILASVAALIVLFVVAAAAFAKLQPTLAPLGLPAGPAAAPSGPLDGTWQVAAGSAAGFRVRESFLGFGNDTVGRTTAVTGTVVISGQQVTAPASTSTSPRSRSTASHRPRLRAASASGTTRTPRSPWPGR